MTNRRRVKAIVKDKSHVSGWEKFRSIFGVAANCTSITAFAITYGPNIAAWLAKALNIGG